MKKINYWKILAIALVIAWVLFGVWAVWFNHKTGALGY